MTKKNKRVLARAALALLALGGITAMGAAFAADIEVSGGMSKFGKGPNGIWYQDGFPYSLKLRSESVSVGGKWQLSDRSHFRAGYLYLGRVSSAALATASDENYAPEQPNHCNGECWPLSNWYGHGRVNGLYAGYVRDLYKPLGLAVEGGVYAYLATWQMRIPDWRHTKDDPGQPLTVTHKTYPYATPYIGVGVGPVWVTYYPWISAQGDGWPSVYKGGTYRVETRISV